MNYYHCRNKSIIILVPLQLRCFGLNLLMGRQDPFNPVVVVVAVVNDMIYILILPLLRVDVLNVQVYHCLKHHLKHHSKHLHYHLLQLQ